MNVMFDLINVGSGIDPNKNWHEQLIRRASGHVFTNTINPLKVGIAILQITQQIQTLYPMLIFRTEKLAEEIQWILTAIVEETAEGDDI